MSLFQKPAALLLGLRVFLFTMILSSCGGSAPDSEPPASLPSGGYIGMNKAAALQLAKESGKRARIISEDGRRMRVTKDYRPERLNFTIKSGKVIRVNRG